MIRGYAWSGAGAITQVEVSVDGETWHAAHIEPPRERFMWLRWSYRWDAHREGTYTLMSRATDEVGLVQLHEPRLQQHAQELQRDCRLQVHCQVVDQTGERLVVDMQL
jgi:hypothetical protein